MHPDDHVCLCFSVSLRKIRTYMRREDPAVASLISECLSAGTGCGWCVPFLEHLHAQHRRGELPDLKSSPEDYARARTMYRTTGKRPGGDDAAEGGTPDTPSDDTGPSGD